jgi:hypothetical protein
MDVSYVMIGWCTPPATKGLTELSIVIFFQNLVTGERGLVQRNRDLILFFEVFCFFLFVR